VRSMKRFMKPSLWTFASTEKSAPFTSSAGRTSLASSVGGVSNAGGSAGAETSEDAAASGAASDGASPQATKSSTAIENNRIHIWVYPLAAKDRAAAATGSTEERGRE